LHQIKFEKSAPILIILISQENNFESSSTTSADQEARLIQVGCCKHWAGGCKSKLLQLETEESPVDNQRAFQRVIKVLL
jgi:hypothetical protein